MDAPGVFGVQTLDDGEAVRAAVTAGAQRAVVVGGGYIGLEMAEAFVQRGLAVTVVEATVQPLSTTLDPDMGVLVADAVSGLGIELLRGEPVTAIATGPDGRVRAVVTAEREIPADVVVLGLGVRPNTELARAAGVKVGDDRRHRHGRADADGLARAGLGGRGLRARPSTGSPTLRSRSRSAPTPTSRAGSPASTSAAGTRPSPASSARR